VTEINKMAMVTNKKPPKEEVIRKKELVRYYQSQIYKLSIKVKFTQKQLVKQIKDYQKEKVKLEKWLKEN